MSIAETASITLLTALPGSGKTLRIVTWLKVESEKGSAVYVADDSDGNRGIKGLKIPHIRFPDPREWTDIPAGSVLVVDEAQDWFRARRSGDPPKYLTDMERIRHRGVRLLLATQQPNYLDAHLRGLVGCHEHMVREEGKEEAKIYRHNEIMDDVRSQRARSRYDSETWKYPKDNFKLYKSAEVHTVKKVTKARTKRGLMMAVGAVVLAAVGVLYLRGVFFGSEGEAQASGGAGSAGPAVVERRKGPDAVPADAAAWAARLEPRIPQIPMSAPIFDGREIVASPRIACAIGESMGCVCLTEQGTRYQLDQFACVDLVKSGGTYDFFREPERDREKRRDPDAPVALAEDRAAASRDQ